MAGAKDAVLTAAVIAVLVLAQVQPALAATSRDILASHWVPGWGFRDELNASDIDHQNFWTDNAGKIIVAGVMTGDQTDSTRALSFVLDRLGSSYYLPEVLVNSSMLPPWHSGDSTSITNRIVLLQGTNESSSELARIAVGTYYASPWTAGYVGADRIWYNGSSVKADSVVVFLRDNVFVERAYFSVGAGGLYTYLNVTTSSGDPYLSVSLQVQPLASTSGNPDYVYLQVFAPPGPHSFENASVFDVNGRLLHLVPFRNGTQVNGAGLLMAYSNRTSVLDGDSAAIRFNGTAAYDVEHYYQDAAFDGLSWIGVGYHAPEVAKGRLSAPVYATIYPIEHLDHRLLTDMARYILSDPRNVAVSPPVSFGFVARGLALESNLDPENATLRSISTGFWNFYYSRYNGSQDTIVYARSVNVFALAGFELYGCNRTVEDFTRKFVGGFPGASIEEYGWAAAALYSLYQCTGLKGDLKLYHQVLVSFAVGGNHFVRLEDSPNLPGYTFQFAESAVGLISGGAAYNDSTVLWDMNAVLQANSSGVILNSPYHGDIANTETLPAYMLAVSLFEDAMRSRTGYWIDWIRGANVTRISYSGGILEVTLIGSEGSVGIASPEGVKAYNVVGLQTLRIGESMTTPAEFIWTIAGVMVTATLGVVLYLLWKYRRILFRPRRSTSSH